jgi:hypothetical protein
MGAWLAARFALSRFYRERVWERKTAAYTAIFEALHEMGRWFDEHITADQQGIELTQEKKSTLADEYSSAKRALERRLAAETWLLPDDCRTRITTMWKELDYEGHDWYELLATGMDAIFSAQRDLRRLVRKDLGLE